MGNSFGHLLDWLTKHNFIKHRISSERVDLSGLSPDRTPNYVDTEDYQIYGNSPKIVALGLSALALGLLAKLLYNKLRRKPTQQELEKFVTTLPPDVLDDIQYGKDEDLIQLTQAVQQDSTSPTQFSVVGDIFQNAKKLSPSRIKEAFTEANYNGIVGHRISNDVMETNELLTSIGLYAGTFGATLLIGHTIAILYEKLFKKKPSKKELIDFAKSLPKEDLENLRRMAEQQAGEKAR